MHLYLVSKVYRLDIFAGKFHQLLLCSLPRGCQDYLVLCKSFQIGDKCVIQYLFGDNFFGDSVFRIVAGDKLLETAVRIVEDELISSAKRSLVHVEYHEIHYSGGYAVRNHILVMVGLPGNILPGREIGNCRYHIPAPHRILELHLLRVCLHLCCQRFYQRFGVSFEGICCIGTLLLICLFRDCTDTGACTVADVIPKTGAVILRHGFAGAKAEGLFDNRKTVIPLASGNERSEERSFSFLIPGDSDSRKFFFGEDNVRVGLRIPQVDVVLRLMAFD